MHQATVVFYGLKGETDLSFLENPEKCYSISSPEELVTLLQKESGESKGLLCVLSEQDYFRTSKLIEVVASRENVPSVFWVLLSPAPESFLQSQSQLTKVLDVTEPETFMTSSKIIIQKALKRIPEISGANVSRIGPTTLAKLNKVLIELTAEKDPQKLLIDILSKAVNLLNTEGGTFLVVDEKDHDLIFKFRIQDSGDNKIVFQEVDLPVQENSLAGLVVLTGKGQKSSNLNRQVDHQHISPIKHLISIPLLDSRGECRAVLQLCNKISKGSIESFDSDDESILKSFSTQAAICLESSDVYLEVQKLFEGFVRASITAIESRDPSTGGHSERVAAMSVALAKATTEISSGLYRSVRFKEGEIKELEYAALLHDFGKIGIREEVLVKSKKLYKHQLDFIQERIELLKASAKIQFLEKKINSQAFSEEELNQNYRSQIAKIDSYWEVILSANEPNIIHQEVEKKLDQIRVEPFLLPNGSVAPLLSDEEYLALSVTQGSLTEMERLEIESHVRHTYQFLKMIPWTREFRGLTEIAYCHHEKLDGSGYPRGLTNHEIPLQSKIMTIADIYDALTAADRWYKEAVPQEKALEILAQEVKEGKLDSVLFDIFKERKIYTATLRTPLGKVA